MDCLPWTSGKKLVHLDLKGAPPKLSYLRELIPLFARLGADGLLLEYEDMFPYEGELQVLCNTSTAPYSREDIQSIQHIAKSCGLEIIPLVQTFGHLEFVLKHDVFSDLRELPHCLGTLNPHRERGVKMLLEMVRQVLELHPDCSHLHIGADEVYILGQGQESRQWLNVPGHDLHQLFLHHVINIANKIRAKKPHLNLIMWDDMLRGMSAETMKGSGLVGIIQPMLWDYSPVLDVPNTVLLLEKYASAGSSHVWAASSFKGSTEVSTCVTVTQRHVDNHLQWLKVAAALPTGVHMEGIAITGWQRYDHLSVLCELLPVGLPSLASCLQTLQYGSFGEKAQTRVTEILAVPAVDVTDIARTPLCDVSSYPGRRLAEQMVELNTMLESEELHFLDNSIYARGWFTPYHKRRRIVNPLIVQQIEQHATILLAGLDTKVKTLLQEMSRLFPEATAEEWFLQHVSTVLEPLQTLQRDAQTVLKEMFPDDPRMPSAVQQD